MQAKTTISAHSVVALTWVLQDSLGESLDVLETPVEFLVGGDDLLPVIDEALLGKTVGDRVKLHIEPNQGFGEFDERLIFLVPRAALPTEIEVGMSFDGVALPAMDALADAPKSALYTVSDLYPEHAVLDGNHPLCGISLDLFLVVHGVREASLDEVGRGSAGVGFFKTG